MKVKFLFMAATVGVMSLFTGCSDDDNSFKLPDTSRTLTTSSGFRLSTDGKSLSDAKVDYVPGASDAVTLRIESTAPARSDIPELGQGDILPGTRSVSLTFVPTMEPDRAIFEGTVESTYCVASYSGYITDTEISVAFSNIVMNDGVLTGTITYTDTDIEHMLEMTYSGAPLMGKSVIFSANPNDYKTVTLTMSGSPLDFSSLAGALEGPIGQIIGMLPEGGVPTPGVFPGSPTFELPVVLGDGNKFNGQGQTDFVTFKYQGIVASDKMEIALTDVKLMNPALSDTKWNVPVMDENYQHDPIKMTWDADSVFKIELAPNFVLPLPASTIVGLMLRMGIIPTDGGNVSVTQMLSAALKSIEFQADGNIVAEYVDEGDPTNPLTKSPINIAQYVVVSESQMLLYLNPQAIIMNAMASQQARSRAGLDLSAFQAVIGNLMTGIVPMVQKGFPISYKKDGDNLQVYLGTEFLLPILKTIAPVFNNEEVVKAIIELAGKNEDFSSMAPMLGGILKSLPDVINTTKTIEIGLNLEKAN